MGNAIACRRPIPALAVCLSAAWLSAAAGFLPQGAAAATPAHADVVANTGSAARAVLARAGAESCLRGKLTKALLNLSSSCEREGRRDTLCTLADRAAVVTPMSLAFMDDTSRGLLQLIDPATAAVALPGDQPSDTP